MYLANVLPTTNFLRALRRLSGYDQRIYCIEEFLSLTDILRSLIHVHEIGLDEIPRFRDLEVSDIIVSELKQDRLNTRAEQSFLNYCSSKRICNKWALSTFIYSFENQMWEKMFCLGFRKYSPQTFITGYAHSVVIPMDTVYTLSRHEKHRIPLPDQIVVNGRKARDVLVDSGFDKNCIHIGGAVRYADTEGPGEKETDHTAEDVHTILVTPTSGIQETVELVDKVRMALGGDESMRVLIKPHPIIPYHQLISALHGLPSNMQIDTRPVQELLAVSDLLVYTETTVSIEALARGIPVLHISSDVRIDMNPLEGYECVPSVSRPEDIRGTAEMLIRTAHDHQDMYRKIASEFFGEVDEDVGEIFLGQVHTM